MIVYRRLINMVPGGQVAVVNMSQYDSDVTLEFELYASEGTFVVQDGTTVLIRGTKPDGNGISLDGTLESTQDPETGQYVHLVTVEVTQQMTAVAGKALYELSLRKDNVELNTANFVLDIERAPLDADTVPSESVIREIDKAVEDYLDEHEIVIDDTLTQQGKAADAKAVRDALNEITPGLSEDAKAALLACFEHVAWIDDDGQDYYDALEFALNGGRRITAIYNQGENAIYTTDDINSIKSYLTVMYTDENGDSQEVTEYDLATEMEQGQSECTVSYDGLKTTFVATITPVTIYYSTSDIVQGGVSYSYPYHNSNANRIGYYGTDKTIVPGKRYKIEYDDNSSGGTIDVGVKRYVTAAYDAAVNQQRLVAEWEQATPHWDKSGIEFRGQQDQKMCFFTFRDSTGNITPSMISNVRLTCIAGNIPIVPYNNDY